MLEIKDLAVAYGPVQALAGVSLEVGAAEIVALLGANGAGKTSLLRAISGLAPVTAGEIRFGDTDLRALTPDRIVAAGIAHAPEGRRIFPDLTVLENLQIGAYLVSDPSAVRATMDQLLGYFPLLRERQRQRAGTLSGGEQQMLAVARALMSSPRLLLLDEPSLGLAPLLVEQIFDLIRQINRDRRIAILLVEQNANEALAHADRAYVLENGRLTLSGKADALRRDPRVRAAYLGL
jgi:branched-chain amino acid transport system ATP-binding protein